MEYTFWL